MKELQAADELIGQANAMIAERDQKRHDANVYRNIIRHHGDRTGLTHARMNRLQKEIDALQEEIDFVLAFAENIIERNKA